MNLKYVTMTGPNDSTKVSDLIDIAAEYPFVEWGVLASRSMTGSARYPSHDWIKNFLRESWPEGINTSLHVCGQWVRDICKGTWSLPAGVPWRKFDRMQLNTHGNAHEFHPEAFGLLEVMDAHPIFQIDGANDKVVRQIIEYDMPRSVIFDCSHGAGIVPSKWPEPMPEFLCTYAGGLGPHNLAEELKKISDIVGASEICVDMETRVRSMDDRIFDLEKVRRALDIASKYVEA